VAGEAVKVAAVIQARLGSSRLPNKVLLPLGGKPALAHVVERARLIPGLTGVLVATTDAPRDDRLAAFCQQSGIPVFRGSEPDVLDRYYQAARTLDVQAIMRITADCPLLDPRESARVLEAFIAEPDYDYASNVEPPYLPDGLDTEVIRLGTLEQIWRDVKQPLFREHVTLYVRKHPQEFRCVSVQGGFDLSKLRWTLDEAADLALISAVVEELVRRQQFGHLHEVLAILDERPELASLNANLERNSAIKAALQAMKKAVP
jgi:spore coat polysaccharide biosynthesis protein SpsF (cytidylyltransferase family)